MPVERSKERVKRRAFNHFKDASVSGLNALFQTLNSGLKDGTDVSGSNGSNLVKSLNATLRKLGDGDGGADSTSSGSEGHVCVVLLL